ncbi:trimeric intracellular cation channel family protein [Aureibacter tunicatorum]|uniref:Membrane protein YeiH n=1 Tax=Aureibacter tunicatorum TaxID=866807 RepID=A0AAE3XMA7_9BACT|nr:trimeric intracellular cation channel family protein [Aureibacter tunicatorum]MDR6239567.1 putative membrane protein YeiH [Aureibacter tunicatorum]BDD04044.1 membrane protein [Aureibacter tunicatorum]
MNSLYVLDLIGTFVFAISGTRAAADKNMDLFGAAFIGFTTALGGGTIRDILLGTQPVNWFYDETYLWVILSAVIFTYLFNSLTHKLKATLFLFDTIGLGVFTIIGIEKSINLGITPPYALIMGMVSAVVGGIIRDTFCNEIPLIFRKEIYATACLIGGSVLLILTQFYQINNIASYILAILIVLAIRIAAIKWELKLPTLN